MKMHKTGLLAALFLAAAFTQHCSTLKKEWDQANVYSVADDKKLGLEVSKQIEKDQKNYPILPEQGNEELYKYVRGLKDKILATGKVEHRKEFAWQVKIINDKKTLNAFCTPGGYIYVYTGLIKYLDSEDQLAGVMGHEIGHAAARHSTRQMTKTMPAAVLADAILGKQEAVKQVAVGLLSLKFSRAHETEADDLSVTYLCATGLNAAGCAGFFKKIEKQGGSGGTPEWLSTHPSSKSRVKDIEAKAKNLGCKGKDTNSKEYERIKSLIK